MAGAPRYPRLFGKYALVAPLARGGMGELHFALSGEADLKKLCVIKQIIGHLSDREFVRRFVDEAKLVVKLSHQNLVPVFESGVEDGQYYLVMEYIEGRDLRAVWKTLETEGRRCPLPVALHICKELCRGLAYAHTFGELELVHRDISPPNVLLSYSGEVRVTDFGLASSRLKMQKTAPGVLFGKLAYMAPEQARNEPLDPRTDIYSAGIIFWELVTGQRAFPKGGSQLEQLQRAGNPSIERPSNVDKELPAAVDLIARRALAPRREDRYPDAEAMRRDIAGLLAKVAPTADNSSVAQLLRELYGDEIEKDRQEREAMLDEMAPAIQTLREEARDSSPRGSAPELIDDDPAKEAEANDGGPSTLAPGTVLGDRYRIEALLREGGMGMVYSATHTGIDRIVAVKVLHPVYSRMPEVVSRFRREARAASRIGHPNIIEIFDSGSTEDGATYFAMEYLVGQDLGDLLSEVGPLPVDRCLGIAHQICQAVGAAHEAGIVHRDLKPENIFLVPREGQVDFVKVLDFGIAQSTHLEETRKERLTHPGMAMGTPEYMAPEQAAGKSCDHRADIYAVGTIIYEMLAGRSPHAGDNVLAVLTAKASGEVKPLSEAREDLPAALERIVMSALAHDPEDRPHSMNHFGYELNKLTGGRAGAVASMLGLADLAPSAPVDLAKLAADESTAKADRAKADQAKADADGEARSRERTVSAELPPTRARRRRAPLFALAALLLGGIGLGAYLLGREAGQPNQATGQRKVGAVVLRTVRPAGDGAAPTSATQPVRAPATRPTVGLRPASRPSAPTTRATVAASQPGKPNPKMPLAKKTTRPPGRRWLVAGHAHLQKGRFRQAARAFRLAGRHRRHRAQALLGLAATAFQQGKYKDAARYAEKARQRGGGWRAELALANYNTRLGRLKAALQGYQRALRRRPGNLEATRGLARTRERLRKRGRLEQR